MRKAAPEATRVNATLGDLLREHLGGCDGDVVPLRKNTPPPPPPQPADPAPAQPWPDAAVRCAPGEPVTALDTQLEQLKERIRVLERLAALEERVLDIERHVFTRH